MTSSSQRASRHLAPITGLFCLATIVGCQSTGSGLMFGKINPGRVDFDRVETIRAVDADEEPPGLLDRLLLGKGDPVSLPRFGGRPSIPKKRTLAATLAVGEEVRVYNWSDYIDEALLEKFEQETGYELIYDVFDSNEVLETKMLAGNSGYDVVVPTADFLERQIAAGAFQPLDYSRLPNAKNLWDTITERAAAYDPGNAYAINYMWGTTGIGVNVDKITAILGDDAPIDSLDLVMNPANMEKLAECGVHFLDAPTDVLTAALAYLGEVPNSHDPEAVS